MKRLILAGLILITGISGVNAASNSWLRNTDVCTYGTMDAYAATSVGNGAVEHMLSEADMTALLNLYRGYRNYTDIKLFTIGRSRDGALIFGNTHGCAVFRMFRRLTWISHVLGREIAHPGTS